jgi:hypothetical protein
MKCTVQEAKSTVKNLVHLYIYIYDVNFLALLGAPYIYDISRLRVKAKLHKTDGRKTRPWHSVVLVQHSTTKWPLVRLYCSIFCVAGADITSGPRVDLPSRVHCQWGKLVPRTSIPVRL